MKISPMVDKAIASSDKPLRIGIMGGTFDPIHFGHLICAEQAREQFELDYVVFMPTGNPVFKMDRKVSDAEHRSPSSSNVREHSVRSCTCSPSAQVDASTRTSSYVRRIPLVQSTHTTPGMRPE